MKRLDKITFEALAGVDKEAEQAYLSTCGASDLEAESGSYRELIESGSLFACAIKENGERIGTLTYAVGDDWFYIVSLVAKSKTTESAFMMMADAIRELAIENGCSVLRAETRRAGMLRFLVDKGFYVKNVELEYRL